MAWMEYCRQRITSLGHARRGIALTWRTQAHARLHGVVAALVVIAGLVCGVSPMAWCALFLAVGLVWVAETLNTAIEFTVDLASPQHHPLAGKAKDVAAGAVLLASLVAVGVGCVIFGPYLLAALVRA